MRGGLDSESSETFDTIIFDTGKMYRRQKSSGVNSWSKLQGVPGSSPYRLFELREEPGDEVESGLHDATGPPRTRLVYWDEMKSMRHALCYMHGIVFVTRKPLY